MDKLLLGITFTVEEEELLFFLVLSQRTIKKRKPRIMMTAPKTAPTMMASKGSSLSLMVDLVSYWWVEGSDIVLNNDARDDSWL